MKCQCEHGRHFEEDGRGCDNEATRETLTTRGMFKVCEGCVLHMVLDEDLGDLAVRCLDEITERGLISLSLTKALVRYDEARDKELADLSHA